MSPVEMVLLAFVAGAVSLMTVGHVHTRFVDQSFAAAAVKHGAVGHSPSWSNIGHYISFGSAVICLLRQSTCMTAQCA